MKAVVIGATGGIGSALAGILAARGEVIGIGRATTPGLDLLDEASIAAAARAVGPSLHLVIDATGFLHNDLFQPEKALRQIDPAHRHSQQGQRRDCLWHRCGGARHGLCRHQNIARLRRRSKERG